MPDKGLFDIHCHIVPSVDDGASSAEEAYKMLQMEYRQGVRNIIATPHYRLQMFETPIETVEHQFLVLRQLARKVAPDLHVYLGCEFHSNMEIRDLLSKPVWQMTGEEFIFLNRHALQGSETKPAQPAADKEKKYVYGIGGIARLFGCSIPTANRIKKSGRIDRAITQIGRKIIVDADMALELAGRKSGGRG